MMPYALFEPVLVVATLHCSSVCILELIYAIKILLVAKNTKKKKKYSPSAQTTHPALSGPVLVAATLCHSPYCIFCK